MFCAVKVIDREGRGTVRCFQSIHIWLLLGKKFGHWGHFGSLRGCCPLNLQYEVLANFYWALLSSLPTMFCIKGIAKKYHCFKTLPFHMWKKRLIWVGVGVGVGAGVGVDFSQPESESESLKLGRLRSPANRYLHCVYLNTQCRYTTHQESIRKLRLPVGASAAGPF